MSENKVKVPVHVTPEMRDEIDKALSLANATSRSDFCRDAIAFYLGYLHQNKSINYLSPMLASAMKSEIRSSTKFICETLYKLAVEQAIGNNVLAAMSGNDEYTLARLRKTCEVTVAETNGILTAEAAARWQNG